MADRTLGDATRSSSWRRSQARVVTCPPDAQSPEPVRKVSAITTETANLILGYAGHRTSVERLGNAWGDSIETPPPHGQGHPVRPGHRPMPTDLAATAAPFAHSRNALGVRHSLAEHLRSVSELASDFANPVGASELAAAAGAWHDLGKASDAFQTYLRACDDEPAFAGHGPDHKGAGSVNAVRQGAEAVALIIQGHHGGLQDASSSRSWIRERLESPDPNALLQALSGQLGSLRDLTAGGVPDLPPLEAEMFVRLLFSCLVDADGLDTEAHFRPEAAAVRPAAPDLAHLWSRFQDSHRKLTENVAATPVNSLRAEIYQRCLSAAEADPGAFRLAVPTGGGKTLGAMGFALRHALKHGLRRIVIAVPFTSITEQTAAVYRSMLGPVGVLEHHSALNEAQFQDRPARTRLWARLAADNWDAPVVVTTTVRLFESLLGNGVSATRRLHRLTRAVIVIDEAQAIPVHVLEPAFDVLRQLESQYGTTVVLSTATQPAGKVHALGWLSTARDIVADPQRYFDALRRVDWKVAGEVWPPLRVASELTKEPTALVIVNTRKDALKVLAACPAGTLHLSTLLCGAHRQRVLSEVRRRLAAGENCRLVSTQVIEAGVDVDFPVVLRAMAPFDSIVQAGGRCNREGRLQRGHLVVFDGGGLPMGSYRTATDITRSLLKGGVDDFDDPAAAGAYFRLLFETVNLDRNGVQEQRRLLAYEEVARRFRMIEDEGTAVVVPYAGGADIARRVSQLADPGEARRQWRRLQPYTVSLRKREIERARSAGWLEEDGVFPIWRADYDAVTGVGRMLMEDADDESAT